MIAPESLPPPLHAYPAPWRPCPGGLDAQELFQKQAEEEALFLGIIRDAGRAQTPLDNLFRQTMRLAFPQASEDDLERSLKVIKARTEDWQSTLDKNGNPAWISVHLHEGAENGEGLHPGGVLPSDAETAAPPKVDTEGRSERDRERPGLFGGILGMFSGAASGKRHQITPESIAAGKGTIPPPERRPLRGIVRLAMLVGLCVLAYRLTRGCTPVF